MATGPFLPAYVGPVQGVILDEMRMYVVGAFGDPAWAEVMKRAGRPANHEYLSDKVYPDEELGLLAMQAAEVSGKPLADVLEGFGEALVPDMFKYYSILANPRWSFIDFLLGMEPLLHSALHLHAPDALPTKVHADPNRPRKRCRSSTNRHSERARRSAASSRARRCTTAWRSRSPRSSARCGAIRPA